jgi:hypothetical protein
VDDYLLHSRLGADAAESTSQAYATALALFLEWTSSLGKTGEKYLHISEGSCSGSGITTAHRAPTPAGIRSGVHAG